MSPLSSNPLSMVNSSLAPQNLHAMWGTSLNLFGDPLSVMQ